MVNKELIGSEVIVFLLNYKNQILLQKRSKFEKHNPNKWSVCSGHVEEYDSSLECAVVREVKEELNADILVDKLIKLNLDEFYTTHFYYTYINKSEKDFVPQKEEVSKIKWYDIGVVINMMEKNYESIIESSRILKLLKILNNKKFIKVMFGNISGANDSVKYKIDDVTTADNWNKDKDNPREMGGFNFSTEDKVLRWLVRGDTIYDVVIPSDAEVVDIESKAAPHGVFRTNKIIIKNPRVMTDDLAMHYYKISDLPEKSYYKSLAGCAIRGYRNTCYQIIKDKVNKDNIDLVISEWNDFHMPGHCNDKGNIDVDSEIFAVLNKIKEDSRKD